MQEMVAHNLSQGKMAIDLSVIPRTVLEVITHAAITETVDHGVPPVIDFEIGPDDEYHHSITALAVQGRTEIAYCVHYGDRWYLVAVVTHLFLATVEVFRLEGGMWMAVRDDKLEAKLATMATNFINSRNKSTDKPAS